MRFMNESLAPSFIHSSLLPERDPLRAAVSEHWFADETALVHKLMGIAELPEPLRSQTQERAASWVAAVRGEAENVSALDSFMQEYDLSSDEGVLLMCLAEALLRIPDDDTAEALIADKLSEADWESHLGRSDSLFVNASTWGLMLTGRLVRLSPQTTGNFRASFNRLIGKSSEPVIRMAVRQAMKLMGHQFVIGRSIAEALDESRSKAHRAYLHSFDMLGEAALNASDARRYLQSYHDAIQAIGKRAGVETELLRRPSISVKLSALHPRYEVAQRERVLAELVPNLLALAQEAKRHRIGLTVDAEEADRLELSLDVFEAVYRDMTLSGWNGFGLAVQAFQKRALPVIEWLEALAASVGRQIPVRLVKGAYWDTEIKRAQEQGLAGYPVFTRKPNTDVSYLACARRLLAARTHFYPQLATHNAHTVAAVRSYAGDDAGYEFQRLHGMGEALYEAVMRDIPVPVRIYAPVGSHEDLLPYLVRRLLENGANSSFVNRIYDENVPPEQLVLDPVEQVQQYPVIPNPAIALPQALYGSSRLNSSGVNFASEPEASALAEALSTAPLPSRADSLTHNAIDSKRSPLPVFNPADRRAVLGHWCPFEPDDLGEVVAAAWHAQPRWNAMPVESRAQLLERAADRLEARRPEFLAALVREAGKGLPDAVAEVREAVDFLRYYAQQARRLMTAPDVLPGPTGEHNELQLAGRGVFVCISPWNFPLAIFTGQIAAALVAGNTVVAKPAEQTNLVAMMMVRLMLDAGIPDDVLQCVLGEGDVGAALCQHPLVAGVAFTGSVAVAQTINRTLAARPGAIASLIAETGGQNAMIADSSALPEQVVKDVITAAFQSAGQRCSALRVLYVQQEIADKVIGMLRGAMQELVVGDPAWLATDVGPVIDPEAQASLMAHVDAVAGLGRLIVRLPLSTRCEHGSFVPPTAVEIDSIKQLDAEHFGPILHVIRYSGRKLDQIIEDINNTGFGLTLGVHSRIEKTWRRVRALARVGNCYVNRNQIGAVVGVQPFGGEGLSGTGPKAGGPHYLLRFVTERTLTVNTSAIGGNARLLAASGDG